MAGQRVGVLLGWKGQRCPGPWHRAVLSQGVPLPPYKVGHVKQEGL